MAEPCITHTAIGNLASDPEQVTSRKGEAFVTMRVLEDNGRYVGEGNQREWESDLTAYDVAVFEEHLQ